MKRAASAMEQLFCLMKKWLPNNNKVVFKFTWATKICRNLDRLSKNIINPEPSVINLHHFFIP
jgi:hypothetical protein